MTSRYKKWGGYGVTFLKLWVYYWGREGVSQNINQKFASVLPAGKGSYCLPDVLGNTV